MVGTLIIFGIFILAAFYSGFYFGYLKREEKPPVMPLVTELKTLGEELAKKKTEEEPKSFYD